MAHKPAPGSPPAPTRGRLLNLPAEEVWAGILMAVITVAIQSGTFLAARYASVPARAAVLATLAAGTLWVALVTGVFAAGAATALRTVVRAGVVCDASAVTLLVLCLAARDPATGDRYVPLLAAAKIYCTYVALALAAAAAVCCARSPAGRTAVGVLVAVVLFASLATPFWMDGTLYRQANDPEGVKTWGAAGAVFANPFYSVAAAVNERVRFVWHGAESLLYARKAVISEHFVPVPSVPWYAAPLVFAALGTVLAAAAYLRHRLARKGESRPVDTET